jgi:hypothetical protein
MGDNAQIDISALRKHPEVERFRRSGLKPWPRAVIPVREHVEDLNIHGLTDLDKPVGC